MIVQRMTFVGKPGRMDEMVEVLKEAWTFWDQPPTYRVYRPISGPMGVLYQEIEFEDWAARAEFWAEGRSKPGWPELMEKWIELIDTGGSNELLGLVE